MAGWQVNVSMLAACVSGGASFLQPSVLCKREVTSQEEAPLSVTHGIKQRETVEPLAGLEPC